MTIESDEKVKDIDNLGTLLTFSTSVRYLLLLLSKCKDKNKIKIFSFTNKNRSPYIGVSNNRRILISRTVTGSGSFYALCPTSTRSSLSPRTFVTKEQGPLFREKIENGPGRPLDELKVIRIDLTPISSR